MSDSTYTMDELQTQNIIRLGRVERLPVDPPIPNQEWALFSFKLLPKPVNGVYGFLKFRGAFPTEEAYLNHAKNIIQGVDSKHRLFPYRHGQWFPITTNDEFVKEEYEVSEQDELSRIYSNKDKEDNQKEMRKVRETQERERMLREESKREHADTDSLRYYAHKTMEIENINTWLETVRKRKRDLLNALYKNKDEIERLNKEHPEYIEQVEKEVEKIKKGVGLE